MDRRPTEAHRRICHILWCAAGADRDGVALQPSRWRHTLGSDLKLCLHVGRSLDLALVAVFWHMTGPKVLTFPHASSNEALHAEVKCCFRQTTQIHQSTMRLHLIILSLCKKLPRVLALQRPAIINRRSDVERGFADSLNDKERLGLSKNGRHGVLPPPPQTTAGSSSLICLYLQICSRNSEDPAVLNEATGSCNEDGERISNFIAIRSSQHTTREFAGRSFEA